MSIFENISTLHQAQNINEDSNCINGNGGINCFDQITEESYTNTTQNLSSDELYLDYEITQQRIGGSSVHSDVKIIDGTEFHDMNGNMQLWSGGVQHFNFKNEFGVNIEFTKNINGKIEDLVVSGLLGEENLSN